MKTSPHAAIYARYSCDRQKPTSIDDQVRECRGYGERRDWKVNDAHVFSDAALSGTTPHRPALQRLLAAASLTPPPFDVILFYDTSRLARNQVDAARIREQLDFHEIRYVDVSQGIDSRSESAEMFFGFNSLLDSYYIKKLARGTHRGLASRAREGLSTGSRCFGYRSVPVEDPARTDPRGRPLVVGARLAVEAAAAETVRRIFRSYAGGRSLKRIARELNAADVPGPAGRTWCHSTVRKILLNDRYRGQLFWNRTYKVRSPKTHRRIRRPRPPTEWMMREVPACRIVSEELWDAAHRQLEQMKQLYANGGERAGLLRGRATRYLFSGLVRCGACGANLNVLASGARRAASYGCPRAQQGACPNRLRIRRDLLETRLLAGLQAKVLRPEVISYALAGFEKELARTLARGDGGRRRLDSRTAALAAKIRNLTRALADGYSPAVRAELIARERELAEVESQLAKRRPRTAPPSRRELRAFVTRRLAELRGLLAGDVAMAKTELLKHVREIRLHPEGGTYRAEGEWDLLGGANTVRPGCSAATTNSGGM
jgi:DNA invertase Pin-like site-specific DNA recombinase